MKNQSPKKRKGIILAGGAGSRLHPLTLAVSKQLLPVYDKPLIYYSLSILMLTGIDEFLIITTPEDQAQFQRLLGDGQQWGVSFSYAVQPTPRGLADAFIIGEEFLDGAPSTLILGDNIFFGHDLQRMLIDAGKRSEATIFASHVQDPKSFGVVEVDDAGKALSVEEKPQNPKSNWAITGLYFFDEKAPAIAHDVKPSARGEIEITSIIDHYLQEKRLNVTSLYRGFAWLDAGTHASLSQASEFIRTIQDRQGLLVSSPDEIAYRQGFITLDEFEANLDRLGSSSYCVALRDIVRQQREAGNV